MEACLCEIMVKWNAPPQGKGLRYSRYRQTVEGWCVRVNERSEGVLEGG